MFEHEISVVARSNGTLEPTVNDMKKLANILKLNTSKMRTKQDFTNLLGPLAFEFFKKKGLQKQKEIQEELQRQQALPLEQLQTALQQQQKLTAFQQLWQQQPQQPQQPQQLQQPQTIQQLGNTNDYVSQSQTISSSSIASQPDSQSFEEEVVLSGSVPIVPTLTVATKLDAPTVLKKRQRDQELQPNNDRQSKRSKLSGPQLIESDPMQLDIYI